ncbi:DNA helicase UvrD [Candidatus Roizmanbacteria bacterium CG22_combo_CG10-13_8_21_14_all_35_9]|uniref:DNA helicase UvrD n=3 Tax=Candidatus Roizmaniibacteriota TaxID=1752723 RepID=A0A2H0BX97_9BACT|nr:MAG: DNA helicase UvrD [Candidatus Roizmanbacteria bacterium CG22_combo_CG10-13_8_21_14_all_35_9]PJC83453.1 MAG: DNA helicase UvrD [Candidatus Roizmanbacteria bacterium CG_4_8_14_3_um_filter_35_14]
MQIIADLHLHSKYSRAVSPQMNLEEISRFAKLKGIQLVATGDWTHPLWFREIKSKFKDNSSGVFQLNGVGFLLSTEISSIYSQGDKLRRIHSVVISPSLETCEKINKELTKRGCNLMADGRPIIGLSAKELLKLVLEIDERVLFIPAHVWTPWFSVFGSKSGFDSLYECFGDFDRYIYAIETGLSSDPIMNWQIKELENRSIVSSSDAHSCPKLGREATVFVPTMEQFNNLPAGRQGLTMKDFTYDDFSDAIKQTSNSKLKIGYTIEFFPEEGKYHWTGHRSCNIKYSAAETKNKGIICPVCNKPLTVGVENRVLELSEKLLIDKDLLFVKNQACLTFVYDKEKKRRPFVSLVPLLEVLLEINSGSPTKAQKEYERLTANFATEFDILLRKPYQEIESFAGEKLRQAIETVRERKVFVDPGYDGVFGQVKIFQKTNEDNKKEQTTQQALF